MRAGDSTMRKRSVAPDDLKSVTDDAVEAAIVSVLDAEKAARADIVRARGDATVIAEEAREQVRCLVLRADRRIRMVRAAFAASVASEVAALESEAALLDVVHDLTSAEVLQVEKAVAALAGAMTGGPT